MKLPDHDVTHESPSQSVLIVDDSPSSVRTLIEFLQQRYGVLVANNGPEALGIAAEQQPDLILLDVSMPDMDGHEVCRQLKSDSKTESIPVIFVTAQHGVEDELTGFELGAVDFISKPFSYLIVERRVRTQMELKRVRDRLEQASLIDELTGIANRRRFQEYLEPMWALSFRRDTSFSVIMSDIDHFKAFNDNYGHPAGDRCLRDVAHALTSAMMRSTDLVARYGGEEFICVLPDTESEGAKRVAERMRLAVEDLRIAHGYSPVARWITISLGIATAKATAEGSVAGLIEAADVALYRAKKYGRNRMED